MSEQKKQAHEAGMAGPPDLADVNKSLQVEADAEPELEAASSSVEDRLLSLEASMAFVKKRIGLPRMMTPEEVSAAADASAEEDELKAKVAAEKELRRYIKRSNLKDPKQPGGFRADLSEAQKARARELLKALGRKRIEWDLELLPDHI